MGIQEIFLFSRVTCPKFCTDHLFFIEKVLDVQFKKTYNHLPTTGSNLSPESMVPPSPGHKKKESTQQACTSHEQRCVPVCSRSPLSPRPGQSSRLWTWVEERSSLSSPLGAPCHHKPRRPSSTELPLLSQRSGVRAWRCHVTCMGQVQKMELHVRQHLYLCLISA